MLRDQHREGTCDRVHQEQLIPCQTQALPVVLSYLSCVPRSREGKPSHGVTGEQQPERALCGTHLSERLWCMDVKLQGQLRVRVSSSSETQPEGAVLG